MGMVRKLVPVVLGAGALALLAAERLRPLRRQTRPELPRDLRNAAMGAMCAMVIQAVESPLARRIAERNARSRRGIVSLVPPALRGPVAIAAMDYTFFLWHIATHKSRFLWRFHRVHHVDPDLDALTGVRFHALDMLVSLPWRLVQVRISGISPRSLWVWRQFFNASILFHHSNLRLPGDWDRRFSWVLTTPKMHGIHHSILPDERDTNWSSGLSVWDRLHGTLRQDIPQDRITIGVADSRAEEDLSLIASHTAPFKPVPPGSIA